ncbi:MAG: hypothetical protein HRF42_06295 [Candidatus Brocadia sp.]
MNLHCGGKGDEPYDRGMVGQASTPDIIMTSRGRLSYHKHHEAIVHNDKV